jgi:hypothetical protein
MRALIEELDPKVGELLGLADQPSPLHVVMVGAFTTNSVVGHIGDDVAVFHCIEWFQSFEGARVLVAHESAHAWHQLALGRASQVMPPDSDLLWTIFSEGLATQASRAAAPNLAEVDYFWYGHPEMDDWVPWCEDHAADLSDALRSGIDDPAAVENLFGAGVVDGRWRVGYFLADRLVAGLGATLAELAALPVADARHAVSEALQTR